MSLDSVKLPEISERIKKTHKEKLIDFLSDPNNPILKRQEWVQEILNLKSPDLIYKHFSGAELDEIEKDALRSRRRRYSAHLSRIDQNIIKIAEADPEKGVIQPKDIISAAKLAYERFDTEPIDSKTEHELRVVDFEDEELDG